MKQLTISLLGSFTVTLNNTPITGFEYNKVRALLAYLTTESHRAHHREVLAELLWPERPAEQARANLRKTLSTLRQAIRDETDPPFLLTDRDTVQFNPSSPHTLDVAVFLRLGKACHNHSHSRLEECPECHQRLAQAADLYSGDFLSQFFVNDSPAFEAWAKVQRESLHQQAMETLQGLTTYLERQHEPERAAQYARRQLELEPTEETAHHQLMRLYWQLGQRGRALAQYETCCHLLANELGVKPTEQTAALAEQIRLAQFEDNKTRIYTDEHGFNKVEILESPQPALNKSLNPYAMRSMIKDPALFVGRRAEQKEIFTRLAMLQSCSIVGPRRIGKSSLLYHLTRPLIYQQHLPAGTHIFAFLDLQELAGEGPADFFRAAMERLAQAGRGRLALERKADSAPGFRQFISRATDSGLRLVLGCDEFEMISQPAGHASSLFTAEFFSYLRGLCSNYNLALVTTSQAGLFELCHQGNIQASQFWNIFSEHHLGLMPQVEAQLLIDNDVFTATDKAFILRLAGPHPFFLQIASYAMFEVRMKSNSPDYAELEQRFSAEARHHYAYVWERLAPAERQLLAALTQPGPSALPANDFEKLKQNAFVTGTPQSPELVSAGWRQFISESL